MACLSHPNDCSSFDTQCNVWEWVQDLIDEDYYRRSPPDDPPGPDKGNPPSVWSWLRDRRDGRVYRGGSWDINGRLCRSAFRIANEPGYRINCLGFRVCLARKSVPGC